MARNISAPIVVRSSSLNEAFSALFDIEEELARTTISDISGQKVPLSKLVILSEGDLDRLMVALDQDERDDIRTTKAREHSHLILPDREYWVRHGIPKEYLPQNGHYLDITDLHDGFRSPDRATTTRLIPAKMTMNGIMQLSNTGWLVAAAEELVTFPGYLIGPANDRILEIIYKYVLKESIPAKRGIGKYAGMKSLQHLKVNVQAKAFVQRESTVIKHLDETLASQFNMPSEFITVRMAIEKAVSIWELSTSASYGEHDYLIALSFVLKQNQNFRKHFTGPKDIKNNLIATCSQIMQANKQGSPMNLTEVFDNIMSAFFATSQSASEMIFFGMDLTVMDVPRHQFRNYRALNKKNLKFPGYTEYAQRTCMGLLYSSLAKLPYKMLCVGKLMEIGHQSTSLSTKDR